MTSPATELSTVVGRSRWLFLDFDGPMCSVFAGRPAPQVADRLRGELTDAGAILDTTVLASDDPFDVLRFAATAGAPLAEFIERRLQEEELEAATTADPTPGAAAVLDAAKGAGIPVAVVSNNSSGAVCRYLAEQQLGDLVSEVVGRESPDPALLKPAPYLVNRAVDLLKARPAETVFVGDSDSDVLAAVAAGVMSIGYANKPGKDDVLRHAGADVLTESMESLAAALLAARS